MKRKYIISRMVYYKNDEKKNRESHCNLCMEEKLKNTEIKEGNGLINKSIEWKN